MPPMKLGLCGLWHVHAPGMIRQITAHPDEFELVACWDPEPDVVAARGSQFAHLPGGGLPWRESLDEVLATPLDGIVVDGRVHQNPWWALKALEAGRPVLMEKPAGTDLDEFAHLQETAAARGLHLQMAYLFRYLPAMQELLARWRAGMLGRVYEFRARMPKDPRDYDQYVADLARYRGGMFFEMAGHMVDLACTLLGEPRRVTPFLRNDHPDRDDGFVDNALAVLEWESAVGVLEVNCLEAAPWGRRWEVYGTKGAYVVPHLGSGHLKNRDVQPFEHVTLGDADWTAASLPNAPVQISDLREFAAVVAGRKKPDWTAAHDLIVQRTLLRASGMLRVDGDPEPADADDEDMTDNDDTHGTDDAPTPPTPGRPDPGKPASDKPSGGDRAESPAPKPPGAKGPRFGDKGPKGYGAGFGGRGPGGKGPGGKGPGGHGFGGHGPQGGGRRQSGPRGGGGGRGGSR